MAGIKFNSLRASTLLMSIIFNLSYRDVVEILHDRGITVYHTTIMRWVRHYGPIFQVLWCRHKYSASQSWRVNENYIKVKGQWCYLYRVIDN